MGEAKIHFPTEQDWIDAFLQVPDDELPGVGAKVVQDSLRAGLSIAEAFERAEAVCLYLGLAVSNSAGYLSTLATWSNQDGKVRGLMTGHWVGMSWDYAEANALDRVEKNVENVARVLENLMPSGRHSPQMNLLEGWREDEEC